MVALSLQLHNCDLNIYWSMMVPFLVESNFEHLFRISTSLKRFFLVQKKKLLEIQLSLYIDIQINLKCLIIIILLMCLFETITVIDIQYGPIDRWFEQTLIYLKIEVNFIIQLILLHIKSYFILEWLRFQFVNIQLLLQKWMHNHKTWKIYFRLI